MAGALLTIGFPSAVRAAGALLLSACRRRNSLCREPAGTDRGGPIFQLRLVAWRSLSKLPCLQQPAEATAGCHPRRKEWAGDRATLPSCSGQHATSFSAAARQGYNFRGGFCSPRASASCRAFTWLDTSRAEGDHLVLPSPTPNSTKTPCI